MKDQKAIEMELINGILAIENEKEKKNMKKEEVKQEVEVKKEETKKEVKPKKERKAKTEKKEKEQKAVISIKAMNNSEMKDLFINNGCAVYTKASDDSKVVYNTFGTKSRVLQQGKAYQLLLTNGHKKVKDSVVESTNDDTARFIKWYDKLSADDKKQVVGYDQIMNTKLSASEMPRERTVKIVSFDLLVKFIKYMATFAENQPIVAEAK